MAKVLIIGSGGREHALAHKISRSQAVTKVFVAPGNGGTFSSHDHDSDGSESKISNATDVPLDDYEMLADWCTNSKVTLVVVGPEVPLANGISDTLGAKGIKCFGPSKNAAALESSKEFAKEFMVKNNMPTARYKSFADANAAIDHINDAEYPALVIKASGLAAGKGVVVCSTKEEACHATRDILDNHKFGSAGEVVVVEELLEGEEFSVLCFSDGNTIAVMPPTQDHKRAYDGDHGPNTGGMGAYGPCPQIDQSWLEYIHAEMLQKTIDGMQKDNKRFVGVLYAGIMMTREGPKVLEFNCRFGDPECQVLLSLLDSDLYDIMVQCCDGTLNPESVQWRKNVSSACVVLASEGYPGKYEKGKPITGIQAANETPGLKIFEAGTAVNAGGVKVTSGGRVLSAVSTASSLEAALELAMHGAQTVNFDGKFYRKDIGWRGIKHEKSESSLTYAGCGVNIEKGDAFVQKISPFAASTSRKGCNASLGGFGALFDLAAADYHDPVLVSGTDGVGTKLLLAQETNQHSSIGQDLVAMCVNDILTHNAEPLFFLDYFSCGKLKSQTANKIIEGIADGCNIAGCALAGGETAEMPGMYSQDHYDLAGFAVGAYDRKLHRALPALNEISVGDVVIGISSTGLHSNGFSMAREVVKRSHLNLHDPCPFDPSKKIIESLLTPTAIYAKALLPILRSHNSVRAVAHITGGGIPGNLSRVVPNGLHAVLDAKLWNIQPVFGWLSNTGNVTPREMYRTFNCGLGICLIVGKEEQNIVLQECKHSFSSMGLNATIVGTIEPTKPSTPEKVVVRNFAPVLQNSWKPESKEMNGVLPPICNTGKDKPAVAVLISGTGTNLQSLIDHEKCGKSSYKISLVISNKSTAAGLQRAADANIRCAVLNNKNFANREEYDQALHELLVKEGIQLICLAGFMRLLSGWFTRKWAGRILNIHPSLLPSFKGMDAHKQVLEAGVKVTGCTVHFVTENMDDGAIIAQTPVAVHRNDDVVTLCEKVKREEHMTYPDALDIVALGDVKFDATKNRVVWA